MRFLSVMAALLLPLMAEASSLRIWVVPNESFPKKLPAVNFGSMIASLAKNGIVIENASKELNKDTGPDTAVSLGYQIARQRELISQFANFIDVSENVERIHVEFISWNDAYQRLIALTSRESLENKPDIVQIGTTWTATFAEKGLLAPLVFKTSEFFPASISSTIFKSSNYAMPWFIDARIMYYWKDLFKDPGKDFSSWENFRAALQKSGRPFVMPIAQTWNLLHNFAPWIWANGADFAESSSLPGYHHAPWQSDEFKDAVKYLNSLASDNLLDLPKLAYEDVQADFLVRKYSTIITTSDWLNYLKSHLITRIGIALPPAGKNGSHPFVGGSNLGITVFAKDNYENCLELINYLMKPENQVAYSVATGFLPANKKGLETYFERYPERTIFKTALEQGYSYPAIPEWGEIFENDITKNHLASLWNNMAAGKSESTIMATLADISSVLNRELFQKAIYRYRVAFLLTLLTAVAGFVVLVRRLYGTQRSFAGQRQKLNAEKILLEAKILNLEAKTSVQTKELKEHKKRLEQLNDRISALKNIKQKCLSPLRITYDGKVFANNAEIKFENAYQAKRLIEYLVRNAYREEVLVNCLRGYLLFDWMEGQMKSKPNRLFDTVVSKVNAPFKKLNCGEPLIVSCGRGSMTWKLNYDARKFYSTSDVALAEGHIENARRYLFEGDRESGAKEIEAAIGLDLKNIEAYILIVENKFDTLKKYYEEARKMLYADLSELEKGFAQIKDNEHKSEVTKIEAEINNRRNLLESVFGERKDAKPLFLSEITNKFQSILNAINEMKQDGAGDAEIWAHLVDDQNFLHLKTIPQIQSLIHNFYDYGTRKVADHRLVELALLWMLSDDKNINDLSMEQDGHAFFKRMEQRVRAEFLKLEKEFASYN